MWCRLNRQVCPDDTLKMQNWMILISKGDNYLTCCHVCLDFPLRLRRVVWEVAEFQLGPNFAGFQLRNFHVWVHRIKRAKYHVQLYLGGGKGSLHTPGRGHRIWVSGSTAMFGNWSRTCGSVNLSRLSWQACDHLWSIFSF